MAADHHHHHHNDDLLPSCLREENLTPNSSPIPPSTRKTTLMNVSSSFGAATNIFGDSANNLATTTSSLNSSYLSSSSSVDTGMLNQTDTTMMIASDFMLASTTAASQDDGEAFDETKTSFTMNNSSPGKDDNDTSVDLDDDDDNSPPPPPARLPLGPRSLRRQSVAGHALPRQASMAASSRRASLDPSLLPVMPRAMTMTTVTTTNAAAVETTTMRDYDQDTVSFQDASMESIVEQDDEQVMNQGEANMNSSSSSSVVHNHNKRRQTMGGSDLLPPRQVKSKHRRMTMEPNLLPPLRPTAAYTAGDNGASDDKDTFRETAAPAQSPFAIHVDEPLESLPQDSMLSSSSQEQAEETALVQDDDGGSARPPRNPRRQSFAGMADPRPPAALRRRMSLGPGVPRPNKVTASSEEHEIVEQPTETRLYQDDDDAATALLHRMAPQPCGYDPRRHSVGAGAAFAVKASHDEDRRKSMGPGLDMDIDVAERGDEAMATPGGKATTACHSTPTGSSIATPTTGNSSFSKNKKRSSKYKSMTPARLQLRAEEANKRRLAKEAAGLELLFVPEGTSMKDDVARAPFPTDMQKDDETASMRASFLLDSTTNMPASNGIVPAPVGASVATNLMVTESADDRTATSQRLKDDDKLKDPVTKDDDLTNVSTGNDELDELVGDNLRALTRLLSSDSSITGNGTRHSTSTADLSQLDVLDDTTALPVNSPSKSAMGGGSSVHSKRSARPSFSPSKSSVRLSSAFDITSGRSPLRRSPRRPPSDRQSLSAETKSPYKLNNVRQSLALSPIRMLDDDNGTSEGPRTSSGERRLRNIDGLFQKHEDLTIQFDKTEPLFQEKLTASESFPGNEDPVTGQTTKLFRNSLDSEMLDSSLGDSLLLSPAQSTRSSRRRRKLAQQADSKSCSMETFDDTPQKLGSPNSHSDNVSTPTCLASAKGRPIAQESIGSESKVNNHDDHSLDSASNKSPSTSSKRKRTSGKKSRSSSASKSPSRRSQNKSLSNIDSPARYTRSAEKKRLSLNQSSGELSSPFTQVSVEPPTIANTDADFDKNGTGDDFALGLTQSFETDKSVENDDAPSESFASKRNLEEPIATEDSAGAASSQAKRHKSDSVRKPALRMDARPTSVSKKSVAFGSPEFVQFNSGSPAAGLTPAEKSTSLTTKAGRTPLRPNAGSMENSTSDSMSMSFESLSGLNAPLVTDVPHEMASASKGMLHLAFNKPSLSPDEEDHTVELDTNMLSIFQQSELFAQPTRFLETVVEQNSHLHDGSMSTNASSTMEVDETVQFAASLGPLLHSTHGHVDTGKLTRRDLSRLCFNKESNENDSTEGFFEDGRAKENEKESTTSEGLRPPHQVSTLTSEVRDVIGTVTQSDQADKTAEFSIKICSPKSVPRSAPYSISRRQRRTPQSGRRLTLTPQRRLSLAPNGDVILNSTQVKMTSALNFDESPPKKEVLDLKVEEVVEPVQLHSDSTTESIDIILEIHKAIVDFGCPTLLERCEMVMSEICLQFMNQRDHEADVGSMFVADDADGAHLLSLQHAIRNSTGGSIFNELQVIADAARCLKDFDLECWLMQVASKMMNILNDLQNEALEVSQQIDEKLESIAEEEELLSIWDLKSHHKAKRRSLDRRKSAAALLEEEIMKLEAQEERVKASLNHDEQQLVLLSDIEHHSRLQLTIQTDSAALQTDIVHIDRSHSLVKTWSLLTPIRLVNDCLSFEYIGPCPAACFSMKCTPLAGQDAWGCEIQLNETLFKKFVGRPLKSVTPLFQSRVRSLAMHACSMYMHPDAIVPFLQDFDTRLNRLQRTAMELASLKQRFPVLLFIEDDNAVLLEVKFSSKVSSKKFLVTFEVTEGYPFSPVTVEVEGDIDLDNVQRLLKRSAKPGFGYLSRTCDMLAANFRCETESALSKNGSVKLVSRKV